MLQTIDTTRLGEPAYLGRVISLLERDPHQTLEFTRSESSQLPTCNTQRIGFTGSPGVGKSTLIAAVIDALIAKGHRVGVIAVDPTSAFSGGAVLGDRIRLSNPNHGDNVFIRSMASRGSMGGVSPASGRIAELMTLAGFDRILIETVGVGQLGYDIISLADTVVALFSPESGDGIQFLKAGLTEIGDVIAVNKADRPGADLLCKEIRLGLDLQTASDMADMHHAGEAANISHPEMVYSATTWEPAVLQMVAKDGVGVDELLVSLEAHRMWYDSLPANHHRNVGRLGKELVFMLGSELSWIVGQNAGEMLDDFASQIASGKLSKAEAVTYLKDELKELL